MQKMKRRKNPRALKPVIRTDAAGIDIGARELVAAVPPECPEAGPHTVRTFGAFTDELHSLADWLAKCGIRTVAMESTGVYWVPAFQILEARGFEVCLINARQAAGIGGRGKTDVSDAEWLQYLHACGLLRPSHRPPAAICAVRALLRQRDRTVRAAAASTQHMQKAMNLMNIQLHHVISDITGVTGMAVIDAILGGQRDPSELAKLRDHRIKAPIKTIERSLRGDWQDEHLFALRQARATYTHYQAQLRESDREIERLLATFDTAEAGESLPPPTGSHRKAQRNEFQFDARAGLHRILGIDLTQIPGFSSLTAHGLIAEVGLTVEKFPSGRHFASWLGLCPDNRISGGKLLGTRTRDVPSRAAQMFRIAAQSLHKNKSVLGEHHRKMKGRLGAPEAITATGHKLARIFYAMIKHRRPYDENRLAGTPEERLAKKRHRLEKQAQKLGFALTPLPS
jgi:transposase